MLQVIIPPDAIWASNAAFATDFHLQLNRPNESAAIQVSITSKDDYGSDIPLSVPPRVHIAWKPKDIAGVQRIRKTWEQNDSRTLPWSQASSFNRSSKSSSLPRHQQPVYKNIDRMLDDRRSGRFENGFAQPTANRSSTLPKELRSSYSGSSPYTSKSVADQDKNWNVVSPLPTSPDTKTKVEEDLPQWAKGYGDQYDYDDVLVV